MVSEAVYDIGESIDGKKGVIFSNPEAIGQSFFVSNAERCTTKTTRIGRDESRNHRGVVELPPHWMGKKVYVRVFRIGYSV